jgi:hypothetical protein
MMKPVRIASAALACLAACLALAQAPAASDAEGLVAVKAKKVDKAWLLPGADFRPYKKVLLKRAEVAFQKGWLRDMNSNTISKVNKVTEADAMKIVEAARSGFDAIWAEAFKKSGYEIVTAPGEGVLEVAPRVVDLYLNSVAAPSQGISRSYTMQAGEATLHMDVRDSRLGTLLGRVSDRRETMKSAQAQLSMPATQSADFAQLFATWAVITVKGLEELKAQSPMPETLKPGQKVGKAAPR